MNVYEISPDEQGWRHNHCIEAAHKWGLPGVSCNRCGFVGGVRGLQYPGMSLPSSIEAGPYLDGSPVTPERQAELQSQLLHAWSNRLPLLPGTKFGPLVGKARGKCGDVAWVNSWTPLLAAAAVEKLKALGLDLTLIPVELKWRSKTGSEYLELQILPGARLSPPYWRALGLPRCAECGIAWREFEPPDRKSRLAYAELENNPVLDGASFPSNWSLLRIEEREANIVASEDFRRAVVELRLTNITFRALNVDAAS